MFRPYGFCEEGFGEVYSELLWEALEMGIEVSPREKKTKELRDVFIRVDGLAPPLVLEGRTSEGYLATEMAWYLSGDKSPDRVASHAKMWDNCRNPDGTVNSNYGAALFNVERRSFMDMGNEWGWCVNALLKDKDSRQAMFIIHRPEHHWEGNRDLPCTLNMRFRIEDGALITRAHMRSCDLWWGLPYDAAWFQIVHRAMLEELRNVYIDLRAGEVLIQLDSAHIYERHWGKAAALVTNGIKTHPLTVLSRLSDVTARMEALSNPELAVE